MPHTPLQSIRGRILLCLALFGSSLTVLVMFAMAVANGWASGILFLGLIGLLFGAIAWHLSTYLTCDVRRLARRVIDTDPTDPQSVAILKRPFEATSLETEELAHALHGFGERMETLTGSLQQEIDRTQQETAEATGTLSDFMYYIAHTLRTPLNAIRWSVETLKNEEAGQVNEEQREILDKLEYSTVKLVSVASELQDALIVLRGEPLRMRPLACNLVALIDEVAGRWAVPVRQKGLRLDWKHPETIPGKIHADPERVSQIVNILIDNAIRYSHGAGKTIAVRLLQLKGKESAAERKAWKIPPSLDRMLVLAVRDEGIGIGAEERERMFHAFFRGSDARDLWVDGKGIGLTLTKAIAQGMNGDVWFTSSKGKGTSMFVAFPLA